MASDARPLAPVSAAAPSAKPRSCVVCRRRKVRCDKASPCANCRRANIACVFPPSADDRPPRWARRLERLTNATPSPDTQAVQVMERLRCLEGLVKELSGQLELAHAAAAGSEAGGSAHSPLQAAGGNDAVGGVDAQAGSAGVQMQFGRLVLKDADRSRYISSGFWSRVDDELYGLKMDLAGEDSDSSEEFHHPQSDPSTKELASSIQELDRTPSERHAFLFRHNLSSDQSDGQEFHPLPSQIPFLLNTYSENVNIFTQVVHMPTVNKLLRGLRGNRSSVVAPSDEALLFSMYYAAVISMEEDDVINNFGTTKGELSLKYRLGLEHALAKADFLNAPNLTLVQAFDIFLTLARRHDSPRFIWMMTGLAIRMAQSLGLHRDGAQFPQLTPYEVEIRRRVWWTLCSLDVRSSEDQGMDYTILPGSFDTKFPLNVNDADISPDTKEPPPERPGFTDMTMAIDYCKVCAVTRQIMDKARAPTLAEQRRLVTELSGTIERSALHYAQAPDGNAAAWWMGVRAVRLTMSKMTLFINFPVLFASQQQHAAAAETRNILLAAAIEVAEYNHALNAEPAARQWRWLYQTYTHWHAVVILCMEIARRPLSPLVERAWLALRSCWLIPDRLEPAGARKLQIWVPLRRLVAAARRHREAEIGRLRGGGRGAVERARAEDGGVPVPASGCPFFEEGGLREHWFGLFVEQPSASEVHGIVSPSQQPWTSLAADREQDPFSGMRGLDSQSSQSFAGAAQQGPMEAATHHTTFHSQNEQVLGQPAASSIATAPSVWPGPHEYNANAVPWLWADADPATEVFGADLDINMDSENDWQNWVESAKNLELSRDGI